jgi:hypothetical protein
MEMEQPEEASAATTMKQPAPKPGHEDRAEQSRLL